MNSVLFKRTRLYECFSCGGVYRSQGKMYICPNCDEQHKFFEMR